LAVDRKPLNDEGLSTLQERNLFGELPSIQSAVWDLQLSYHIRCNPSSQKGLESGCYSPGNFWTGNMDAVAPFPCWPAGRDDRGGPLDRFNAFFYAYPFMAVYFFCSADLVAALLITRMPRSAVMFAATAALVVGVAIPASGLI
jgi:hypothetical protein